MTTIPRWVECYYAVPSVGRVLVFGNHRLAAAELRSVLERSGATVVIGPRAELDRIVGADPPGVVERVIDLDEWETAVAVGDAGRPDRNRPAGAGVAHRNSGLISTRGILDV